LGFGEKERGRKGLGRDKPSFENLKKLKKCFGGLGGFILSNFKVPLDWVVLEG
jgi:hypothetical protein